MNANLHHVIQDHNDLKQQQKSNNNKNNNKKQNNKGKSKAYFNI